MKPWQINNGYLGEKDVSQQETFLNMTQLDFALEFISLEIGVLSSRQIDTINTKIARIVDKIDNKEWFLNQLSDILSGLTHKDSLLKDIDRILNGEQVFIFEATWENGNSDYRYRLKDLD